MFLMLYYYSTVLSTTNYQLFKDDILGLGGFPYICLYLYNTIVIMLSPLQNKRAVHL